MHPGARPRGPSNERPRIISDDGPQFIAKDFKEFIRLNGMTHVRTAPYYPQSKGKVENVTTSGCHRLLHPGRTLLVQRIRWRRTTP